MSKKRLRDALSTAFYWLRTHTIHRYHIVDMRSPRNGYKWGWIDRSEGVMYAAFAVLVDFVENEYPGMVDWDWSEESRTSRDEFMALYRWWTKERKEEHDAHDAECSRVFATKEDRKRIYDAGEALEAKDTEMLIRLIKVRNVLWT
jgi:hypothetical protein